jgi:HAD superfamily hydrolase (TIGR01548 family)
MVLAPPGPAPVASLRAVRSYSPPRHPAPIELRLDGNEGMEPPAELLAELARQGPAVLRQYPSAAALESLLAARWAVAPAAVLVTAGGDDALFRAFAAVLGPGRELILPVPTFEMLPRYGALSGATLVPVPWPSGPLPLEAILSAANARTSLICVVSPNNPTGAVALPGELERIAREVPHALLVADLAYEEFADAPLMETVLRLPNAIAVRSLSKAWGMAGLRVGYAAGPPEIIAWLRAAGNPYAVSAPSLWMAHRRLSMPQHDVHAFVAAVKSEREKLRELLQSLGAGPVPSQGNFVLSDFKDASWVRDALAGLGIAVRLFPDRPELHGKLRITTPGSEADFARLEHALRAALRPEALLFDLDGVIADVSGSYRKAIEQTAALWGVELTAEDIARAKAAGDSNNDWVLTRRLLAERGVDVALEEVTARFERLYQGTPQQPGLHQAECLACDVSWLLRLAARFPVGIVTGRPRADAERFLRQHGLLQHLRTVVCMEDAALKPDPAPVRLALRNLGVQRAWMVGDSPDDMRAARGAGVVPIGVVAPGDPYAPVAATLGAAGASRVLSDIRQLEEWLP